MEFKYYSAKDKKFIDNPVLKFDEGSGKCVKVWKNTEEFKKHQKSLKK